MDRDETPIGGLSSPLQPTRQLFHVTIALDFLAILLSITINIFFAAGVVVYILASRAYSYRGIRLKKYPVIGFLTVFIFQGGWIYYFVYRSIVTNQQTPSLLETLLASLLIGALYPLTQIYQHKEDLQDGVKTISYLLGKRGTFVFSMLLFLAANTLMFILFNQPDKNNHFFLFLLFLLPVVLFFLYWMSRVWKDEAQADFTNSLRMNVLATLCTTAFFITLIILNH